MRIVAIVALVSLAAGTAGCTKTAPGNTPPAGPSAGRHSWTVPDTLRIAFVSSPNTLNPILSTQQFEAIAETLAFDPLIATKPGGEDVPILASAVPSLENGGISADGKTITYHLRHGVKWQDGAPFTSRDVRFTVSAIMNPKTLTSTRHGYDDIERVDTPDAYTAIFHLKKPFSPAVDTFFAHSDAPFMILPAHLLERYPDLNQVPFNSLPVGTGPFKVVRWVRGDRIDYVANDAYFLGKPKLRAISLRIIPDENTAVNQIKSHEIDWLALATPRTYEQLRQADGIDNRLVPTNAYDAIMFNIARAPLSDVRLRRAIALAIDKRELAEKLTFGTAVPASEDLPPFLWAANPHAATPSDDVAKARALLDSAGWTAAADGIRAKHGVRLSVGLAFDASSATDRTRAVVIASRLKESGIDVELKGYTESLFYGAEAEGGILASGKYDMALETWYSGNDPDNSTQLLCSYFPPNGYNWTRYCNPQMDVAQADALSHYDRATRKRDYAKIEQYLADDVPFIYLWWPRQIEAINVDLHGFEPDGIVDDWNAYTWSI